MNEIIKQTLCFLCWFLLLWMKRCEWVWLLVKSFKIVSVNMVRILTGKSVGMASVWGWKVWVGRCGSEEGRRTWDRGRGAELVDGIGIVGNLNWICKNSSISSVTFHPMRINIASLALRINSAHIQTISTIFFSLTTCISFFHNNLLSTTLFFSSVRGFTWFNTLRLQLCYYSVGYQGLPVVKYKLLFLSLQTEAFLQRPAASTPSFSF